MYMVANDLLISPSIILSPYPEASYVVKEGKQISL